MNVTINREGHFRRTKAHHLENAEAEIIQFFSASSENVGLERGYLCELCG